LCPFSRAFVIYMVHADKTGVKGKVKELRRNAKIRLKTVRDPFAVDILNELVGILDDVLTASGE